MTSAYAVLRALGPKGEYYYLVGLKKYLSPEGLIYNNPGMPGYPGGHIDSEPGRRIERGEDAYTAARREFLEETGTSLDARYICTFKVGNGVFVVFETTMKRALDVVQNHCENGAADPEFSSLALVGMEELRRLICFRSEEEKAVNVEKVVEVYLQEARKRGDLHQWARAYYNTKEGLDGKRLREAIRVRVIMRSANDWFVTAVDRLDRLHHNHHL
jgi:predicted NUDIX family NTP pyrophosphohydrolase